MYQDFYTGNFYLPPPGFTKGYIYYYSITIIK